MDQWVNDSKFENRKLRINYNLLISLHIRVYNIDSKKYKLLDIYYSLVRMSLSSLEYL